jgi:phosphoketolase
MVVPPGCTAAPLSAESLKLIDAWWRAANYLSVGQIYLLSNALLREPLRPEHVKPRLLGHWGTTPGLNFIYAHMNRAISARELSAIYVTGPGHGGPGLVASAYLDGTYSEVYPHIGRDEEGLQRLFRQFSFPGGIPSHVAPETPGSIHEGGELGYSLLHAYGAVLDNPDLLALCVVGDGEAETGPLARGTRSGCSPAPARAIPMPSLRSTCTFIVCARGSPRWSRRWRASTCSPSRAGWGSAQRRFAPGRSRDLASSASTSTRTPTGPPTVITKSPPASRR